MITFGKVREALTQKRDEFSAFKNRRAADELKRLKKTREREEGKARLIKRRDHEKDRIKKARETKRVDLKRRFGIPDHPKKEAEPRRGFGEGINPAFGGKEKPKEKKKDIVIRIKQ